MKTVVKRRGDVHVNEAINSSQVNEYKNLENHVLIDVRETDELEQTGFVPGEIGRAHV